MEDLCQKFPQMGLEQAHLLGETPLHSAASNGDLESCRLLMEKLDNKNPGDNHGWTPLHRASENGHLHVCRFILENISDLTPGCLSPRTNFGQTPFDIALQKGHVHILQLFREYFFR